MDDCDQTSNMQKGSVKKMSKALVIIDIQNDITKNYRDIIDKINKSVDKKRIMKGIENCLKILQRTIRF